MKRYLDHFRRLLTSIAKHPYVFSQSLKGAPSVCDAYEFSHSFQGPSIAREGASTDNPLREYFESYREGPGIWKWEHYFDIYHRHLSKFVGTKVDVVEIGIYSGGSLGMWRTYFGNGCHVYGVDIEPACKAYESTDVSVFIGDQADRGLWKEFKNKVGKVDIVIDDGGHTPEQQQVTLQEMLPALRDGGVYICEDIHGAFNRFSRFATGLANELNATHFRSGELLESTRTAFQNAIHSIHFYPYMVVIEKHAGNAPRLAAPKHGTEWQPFFDDRRARVESS